MSIMEEIVAIADEVSGCIKSASCDHLDPMEAHIKALQFEEMVPPSVIPAEDQGSALEFWRFLARECSRKGLEPTDHFPVFDSNNLVNVLRERGLTCLPMSLQQAIVEREQLQQKNYQLQHKLAEFFRKKKADESRQEYDKNVTDQEQRYLKYMGRTVLTIS